MWPVSVSPARAGAGEAGVEPDRQLTERAGARVGAAAVNVHVCSSTSRAVAGAAGTASPARHGTAGTRSVRCSSETRQARWRCPGSGEAVGHHDGEPAVAVARRASSRSSTLTRRTWQSSVASCLVGHRRRMQRAGRLDGIDQRVAGHAPCAARIAASVMTLLSGTPVRTLASGASGSSVKTRSASHGTTAVGQRARLHLVDLGRRVGDQPVGIDLALPRQRAPAEHDVGQDLVEGALGVARRVNGRDLVGRQGEAAGPRSRRTSRPVAADTDRPRWSGRAAGKARPAAAA